MADFLKEFSAQDSLRELLAERSVNSPRLQDGPIILTEDEFHSSLSFAPAAQPQSFFGGVLPLSLFLRYSA